MFDLSLITALSVKIEAIIIVIVDCQECELGLLSTVLPCMCMLIF